MAKYRQRMETPTFHWALISYKYNNLVSYFTSVGAQQSMPYLNCVCRLDMSNDGDEEGEGVEEGKRLEWRGEKKGGEKERERSTEWHDCFVNDCTWLTEKRTLAQHLRCHPGRGKVLHKHF